MTVNVNAEGNFNEVQTTFNTNATGTNGILTILKNWAQSAASKVINSYSPDDPISSGSIGPSPSPGNGSTSLTSPSYPSPLSPSNPWTEFNNYLSQLKEELDEFISPFQSWNDVITGPPTPAPSIDENEIPSLAQIVDIATPSVSIPTWNEDTAWAGGDEAMNAASSALPISSFNYNDEVYQSELLDNSGGNLLYQLIASDLQLPDFGVDALVDERIFEQAREREAKVASSALEDTLRIYSSGGFTMPTGAAYAAMHRAKVEMRDKISSINRELAAKRSDIILEAKKNTINSALALEQMNINAHNTKMDRLLRKATEEIEATIKIAAHNLERIKMFVEKYKAYASVFEARIRGEVATIELYKSQVDAESVKANLNKAIIDAFVAKNRAVIDAYLAQVEGYKINIDGRVRYHAALADSYRAKVDEAGTLSNGMRDALGASQARTSDIAKFYIDKYNGDINKAKITLEEATQDLTLWLEQYKTQAQSVAALAAAAMSALNVNLGLSVSGQASISGSESLSEQEDLSAGVTRKSEQETWDRTKGTHTYSTNYNYEM